jgi:hypothetical protein
MVEEKMILAGEVGLTKLPAALPLQVPVVAIFKLYACPLTGTFVKKTVFVVTTVFIPAGTDVIVYGGGGNALLFMVKVTSVVPVTQLYSGLDNTLTIHCPTTLFENIHRKKKLR